MLEEGEGGPLGVAGPEGEDGFRAFEGGSSREVEEAAIVLIDGGQERVVGGEADEFGITPKARKDIVCMLTLGENEIDGAEAFEMTLGKAFLIRDQNIKMSCAKPIREDTLDEDIDIIQGRLAGGLFEPRAVAEVADDDGVPVFL